MNEDSHEILNEMEEALCRLGKGGKVEETHLEEVLDPETGSVKQIKRKRTIKIVRPDYRALTFWLTNRMANRWNNKPQNTPPEDDNHWYDEDWCG